MLLDRAVASLLLDFHVEDPPRNNFGGVSKGCRTRSSQKLDPTPTARFWEFVNKLLMCLSGNIFDTFTFHDGLNDLLWWETMLLFRHCVGVGRPGNMRWNPTKILQRHNVGQIRRSSS